MIPFGYTLIREIEPHRQALSGVSVFWPSNSQWGATKEGSRTSIQSRMQPISLGIAGLAEQDWQSGMGGMPLVSLQEEGIGLVGICYRGRV